MLLCCSFIAMWVCSPAPHLGLGDGRKGAFRLSSRNSAAMSLFAIHHDAIHETPISCVWVGGCDWRRLKTWSDRRCEMAGSGVVLIWPIDWAVAWCEESRQKDETQGVGEAQSDGWVHPQNAGRVTVRWVGVGHAEQRRERSFWRCRCGGLPWEKFHWWCPTMPPPKCTKY